MFDSQNGRELLKSVLIFGLVVAVGIMIIVGMLAMIKLDNIAKDQAAIRQSIERLEQDLNR